MGIFWVLECILVIFRFRGYFGYFLGFGGYFGHFLGSRIFWSFFGFWGYLVIFRCGAILVIFEDFRVLWSFSL